MPKSCSLCYRRVRLWKCLQVHMIQPILDPAAWRMPLSNNFLSLQHTEEVPVWLTEMTLPFAMTKPDSLLAKSFTMIFGHIFCRMICASWVGVPADIRAGGLVLIIWRVTTTTTSVRCWGRKSSLIVPVVTNDCSALVCRRSGRPPLLPILK